MSRQVFDIFVGLVDDFRQLLAIDQFFIDVHGNTIVEIGKAGSVWAHNFGYCGAPDKNKINISKQIKGLDQRYLIEGVI